MIRVLLADDQRVVREGLGMLVGLLDGRLAADRTPDGFRVELYLPQGR